jgi:hypothetical protein
MRLLLLSILTSCSIQLNMTDSNRFAMEYSAREYSASHDILHHSCDWVAPGKLNTCYGLMAKGMVVRFYCGEDGCVSNK